MAEDICAFNNILHALGYKLTTQRQTVLEVIIKNSNQHLSVEEIFKELKGTKVHVGLATVYRNIKIFEKLGFVRHIALEDGELRYQIIDPEEKREHYHLICESCGNVIDIEHAIDIPKYLLERFGTKVYSEKGFTITHQKIQFFGKCKNCLTLS